MSTIAIFGFTGYVGGHITTEALRRGHDVIGISRSEISDSDSDSAATARTGSISDRALVRDVAKRASTLVVAVHAAVDGAPFLPGLVPSLLESAATSGSRIGFVGGAGNLLIAAGGPRLVDTPEFPAFAKTEAESQAEALKALQASDSPADWFYLSPAAGFGPHAPGERTGVYRIGGEVLLTDADGNSYISGADYAVAFLDEIDTPNHHRQPLSVAY
jgi:putative NADH-flavin reductase